jgi:hypothetical protein
MKKIATVVALSMVMAVAGASAQTTLFWVTDSLAGVGTGPDIVDYLGATAALGGFTIEMFISGDGTTMDPSTDASTGLSAAAASVQAGSFFETIVDYGPAGANLAGKAVYTVITDNRLVGGANPFAIVDDAPFTVPPIADPPLPTANYNAGSVAQGDWVVGGVIPEPSTYALLGLGALALIIRRLRKA